MLRAQVRNGLMRGVLLFREDVDAQGWSTFAAELDDVLSSALPDPAA